MVCIFVFKKNILDFSKKIMYNEQEIEYKRILKEWVAYLLL